MAARTRSRSQQLFRYGAVVLAFASALLVLALADTRVGEWLEGGAYDVRMRMAADPARADKGIIVIDIDNASFDLLKPKLGRWPWTRRVWAMIVGHVSAGKPRAIVFDFVYGGQESTEVDQEFAQAIRSAGNVVLGFSLSQAEVARTQEGEAADANQRAVIAQESIPSPSPQPTDRTFNVPERILAQAAAGSGCANAEPDADGVIRAAPFTCAHGQSLYRTLSVRTVALIQPERWRFERGTLWQQGVAVPRDSRGRLLLRWHGLPYERIPLWYVGCSIAPDDCEPGVPKYPPEFFRDKIVLVGASAAAIFDNHPTPFAAATPGVLIHATAIDNLLHGDSMQPAPSLILPILTFVLASAAAGALLRFEAAIPGAATVLAILALFAIGNYMAFERGVVVPLVPPVAALALTYISASTLRYATTGRELRQTRNMMGRYMSPQLLEHVLENVEQLDGRKGDLSILFSDVRNFTTLSEKADPVELVELLNQYLEAMTEIVFKYDGVVDKFMGDGMLAYWGAFSAKDRHAELACRAALEMLVKLDELNAGWREQGRNGISIGIGVNSGEVIFGNLGRGKKMEFTVIGDPVNLAARLESLNKEFGTNIVVSEFTVAKLGSRARVRPLGGVKVKGKTVETAVFELLAVEDGAVNAATAD